MARLVSVRLLLRHLLILFLGIGSLMILLPRDVFFLFLFPFGALYFGRPFCIDMGCIYIGYCIYDICGLLDSIYGYVFIAMCMDVVMDMYLWLAMCMDVFGYVFLAMGMDVSGYVYAYVYGYRVLILREARFNKYRGLPFLGAHFQHHWDLLFHETHFNKFWVLLLHEAHLDDSSNFFRFFPIKMEKFAPVCSVE